MARDLILRWESRVRWGLGALALALSLSLEVLQHRVVEIPAWGGLLLVVAPFFALFLASGLGVAAMVLVLGYTGHALLPGAQIPWTPNGLWHLGLLGGLCVVWVLSASRPTRFQRWARGFLPLRDHGRRSEADHRLMIENVRDVIFRLAEDGTWAYLNPAWESLSGVAVRDSLGQHWLERVHPEDRDQTVRSVRALLKGEAKHCRFVTRLLRPDDQVRWVEIHAQHFCVEDGWVRGASGTIVDVTEREKADAISRSLLIEQVARREAERNARRSQFLSEVGDLLAVSLSIEEAARGLSRKLLHWGGDWAMVCVRGDGDVLDTFALASAQEEGRDGTARLEALLPAMLTRWVEKAQTRGEGLEGGVFSSLQGVDWQGVWSASDRRVLAKLRLRSVVWAPVRFRGEVIGVLALGSTQSLRAYESLDTEVLQEVGARLSFALENARLFRTAHLAARAKSDFLAVMSHELRTPLTAVVGYAELLELGIGGDVSAEQVDMLRRINACSHDLLELIEGILDYTRYDAGRLGVSPESVSLSQVVEEAARPLLVKAQEKGIGTRLFMPETPSHVWTDPAHVRRIVVNLLDNSIRFTERGFIEIRLEVGRAGTTLVVSDTGRGISPGDLEQVFDPFWQAEGAMTRQVGGTGLGLTVVKQLVTLLGGTIEMESQVGKGTRAVVHLPSLGQESAGVRPAS